MAKNLKMSDLFVEYRKMDSDENGSIIIVQVLNYDTYYAVRLNNAGELSMGRFLNRTLKNSLKNNTLTTEDLLQEVYCWEHISKINSLHSKSDIVDLIEEARKSGYKEEIIAGKWKLVKPPSAKEKKKAQEEARKKEAEERKWKKVRIVAKIVLYLSLFIAVALGEKAYSGIIPVMLMVVVFTAAFFAGYKEKD